MEREAEAKDNLWRARLDAVLMHRIWGSLIFLGIVYIIFFLSFAIGDPGPACNPCWGKAW